MFLYCKESQEKEFLNSNIGKSFVLRFSDNPNRMLGIEAGVEKDQYWRSDLYQVVEGANRLHKHLKYSHTFETSSRIVQEFLICMVFAVQGITKFD